MNDSTKESLAFMIEYWRDSESPFADEAIAELSLALATADPLGSDEHWAMYFQRLEGPGGCNFQGSEAEDLTWECKGGMDKTFSARILRDLGLDDLQVEAVHRIVNALGGHCDCEILFNAADRVLPSWRAVASGIQG